MASLGVESILSHDRSCEVSLIEDSLSEVWGEVNTPQSAKLSYRQWF